MLRRFGPVSVLLLTLACGKGPGETEVSGSVQQISFSDPVAVFNVDEIYVLRDQVAVLISDDPSACEHMAFEEGQNRPFLKMPDGSHAPSLWLNMTDHSAMVTDLRGVGDDLDASFDPGAPAGDECGQAACQSRWLAANKGSARISSSDSTDETGAAARGEFYLTFDTDQISGTFKAVPCKGLKVDGCSAGGAGLFPGLALVAVWSLRRKRTA
ncbi:MAG: hypothetical protein HY901_23235 [Deltaproteobacteria bacterium]|nr:hypothetical protein [Deltaproteobacteria bacterium]